jgi:DNA-directed RNA polymerase specialized sigma24 family protein
MVLVEGGHMPAPEPGAPGIFAMADPGRIRQLVIGAGFGEPSIEQVAVEWGYVDAAEHWEKTNKLAAPIAEAVSALPPEQREAVRATVAERLETLLAGDASGANGVAHVVVAE